MEHGAEIHSAVLRADWKRRVAEWEGVFGLDPEPLFFEGWKGMAEFDFDTSEFSVTRAWWLGELCRLVYTPDHKELGRDRFRHLPRRSPLLEERTPFSELLSVHKTGNHAAIYRRSDGEGGTILCFRGTNRTRQWVANAVFRPHGWRRFRLDGDPEGAFVHSGFYVLFKRIWPLIQPVLEVQPRPWIFTGHSLGGALATLAGTVARPDLVCTFAAPKVGNGEYGRLRNAAETWRVVNHLDIVPRLPLPDRHLRDCQFAHGREAFRLDEEGRVGRFAASEDEDVLPFSLRALSEEFRRPPAWICDHRIGEYCRKLRSGGFSADA